MQVFWKSACEDNMTLHVCLYQIERVSNFDTCSNSTETKSWRALENNAISLQYREIYEGRTGLCNVYRCDNNVICLNLKHIPNADSDDVASSGDVFSVARPTKSQNNRLNHNVYLQ